MTALAQTASARPARRDHAPTLVSWLRQVLGSPVSVFHPVDGKLIASTETSPNSLLSDEIQRLASDGEPHAHPRQLPDYDLVLPLEGSGVAIATFTGVANNEEQQIREQALLVRWLTSLQEQWRLEEALRREQAAVGAHRNHAKQAWEGMRAVHHTLRRIKPERDSKRNQFRVFQTLHELLGVETLVWIPADLQEPLHLEGERLLRSAEFHMLPQLLKQCPTFDAQGPWWDNDLASRSWGFSYRGLRQLLAVPVADTHPAGWILALNKKTNVPFQKSDAALLTPLLSLFRLQNNTGRRLDDLQSLVVGLARTLTSAIDAKDQYTFGHSERVARIAVELGNEMALEPEGVQNLYLAGLLHDVGKIGVPDAILRKEGALTSVEFEQVKQHTILGHAILSDLLPLQQLLPGVLYHHERWDGNGYPERLVGERIPQIARILAVADAYDAMSTIRPYRKALSFHVVEDRLKQGAGVQWDPAVIDAFMRCRQKVHLIRQCKVNERLRQALEKNWKS